jgi:hypothetical protein
MDSVALQQFLALHQSAQGRMQQSAVKPSASATNWQTILEAKRSEMGIAPAKTAVENRAMSVQQIPQGDYQARAENLRSQMAQGLPVRSIGSLLDVRA